MTKRVVKKYNKFIKEGKREQAKIDELLDIIKKRKLTDEEKDLLTRLGRGESLPEESKPVLQTHKTGCGYIFDEEGDVLVEEEPDAPGKQFFTAKGKQKGVDKLKIDQAPEARVYKNKNSEIRQFFVNITKDDKNDWIIYRTVGKTPFGEFCDTNSSKYSFYKNMTPEQLWEELDNYWDYGMVLDNDLYQDFMNFAELFKEDQVRYREMLTKLRNRFLKLL